MIRPSASENRHLRTVDVLFAAYSDMKFMSAEGKEAFWSIHELGSRDKINPAEFIEAFWRLPAIWQLILEPMLEQYGVKMVAARLV